MTTSLTFLAGGNPLEGTLPLFLIQVSIILVLTRALGYLLKKVRQPRVIAEVIGGIILGPSALSRIEPFQKHVFPKGSSMTVLQLVANLGLIFFLFLVGLEMDLNTLKKNIKRSLAISTLSIAVPLGVSIPASLVLYQNLTVSNVPASSFMIFIGVAMAITAFPVLARILTERKLIHTHLGQATLSAACIGDAIAWSLLVLVVSIVTNSANYAMAAYVFLTVVGFFIFLWFTVKPGLKKLLKLTRKSSEPCPPLMVFIVLLLVCIAAWFTETVGVHAIFGAFLVGMLCPHDGGFAIHLTEKIEDFCSIVFLPLYFAYSGLNTRIDQLNTALAWGLVVYVIVIACVTKILASAFAAKWTGMTWRESWTIGFLMNTKGLVELIVLNIGLDAGVLDTTIFTVLVMMALVTTFMTTPLVTWIYPLKYYVDETMPKPAGGHAPEKAELTAPEEAPTGRRRGRSLLQAKPPALAAAGGAVAGVAASPEEEEESIKVLMCLTDISVLVPSISITQMLKRGASKANQLEVHTLRILPLSERQSSVFLAEDEEVMRHDVVLNVYCSFVRTINLATHAHIAVSAIEECGPAIVHQASKSQADIAILPFHLSGIEETSETMRAVQNVFVTCNCSVAVFLDRGFGEFDPKAENATTSLTAEMRPSGEKAHILMPFFGSQDDRECLRLVSFLAGRDESVRLTLLRFRKMIQSVSGSADSTLQLGKGTTSSSTTAMIGESGGSSSGSGSGSGNGDSPRRVTDVELAVGSAQPIPEPDNDELIGDLTRRANVTYEEVESLDPVAFVIERAIRLSRHDVLIYGRHPADDLQGGGLHSWAQTRCTASVCVVRRGGLDG